MKENALKTVILSVAVGTVLSMGSLAYAGEQTAGKPEARPVTVVAAKPDAIKPVDEGVSIDIKVPFFSAYFDEVPLATVGDEQVTVWDLRKALESVHEKMTQEKDKTPKKSFMETLQRLINARLAVLEARNIELDKLPEIKADLSANAEMQLRQVLFEDHVKDIKPDEKEVDKLYKESIREWKLKSIAFHKESDAKKFEDDLKGGKSFDELREKAIKDGLADKAGQNEELYASRSSLGPILGNAVSNLKNGELSPAIKIPNAFLIVMVEDSKSVENPALKEKVRSQILSRMRLDSLKKYKDDLYKKYGKENTKRIKSIDFEAAKPGLAKLLKDKREIVSIKGEKPVTVSELAEAVKGKYYHGVENAIKEKKVNREKLSILDEIVSKRVFRKEALEKGIDKSEEYLRGIKDHENTVLFGAFIEKAVKPNVEIKIQELKDYYNGHLSEFKFPEMVQVDDIAFKNKSDAQTAIDKLRKGMDFNWLKNNADNQVDKDNPALLSFGDQMLSVKSFPEELQKSLDGAKPGDFRFYGSPEGIFYALSVGKVVPSRTQTFDEVKNDIAQKVAWENLSKEMDDWFKKLREAYPVKIYLQEK